VSHIFSNHIFMLDLWLAIIIEFLVNHFSLVSCACARGFGVGEVLSWVLFSVERTLYTNAWMPVEGV